MDTLNQPRVYFPPDSPLTRRDWEEMIWDSNLYEIEGDQEFFFEDVECLDENNVPEETKHFLFRVSPKEKIGWRIDLGMLSEDLRSPPPKAPRDYTRLTRWYATIPEGPHKESFVYDPMQGRLLEDVLSRVKDMGWEEASSHRSENRMFDPMEGESPYEDLRDQVDEHLDKFVLLTDDQREACHLAAIEAYDKCDILGPSEDEDPESEDD